VTIGGVYKLLTGQAQTGLLTVVRSGSPAWYLLLTSVIFRLLAFSQKI
jgi:hypothetical protein